MSQDGISRQLSAFSHQQAEGVTIDIAWSVRLPPAVSAGAAGSWALNNLGPRMLTRDFAPMFMIDLQQKDLEITLSTAQEHSVLLPGTALLAQLLAAKREVD